MTRKYQIAINNPLDESLQRYQKRAVLFVGPRLELFRSLCVKQAPVDIRQLSRQTHLSARVVRTHLDALKSVVLVEAEKGNLYDATSAGRAFCDAEQLLRP